jgi:hypothetical protein
MDIIAYLALLISILALGNTFWRDRVMDSRVKRVEAEQKKRRKLLPFVFPRLPPHT